MDLNFSSSDFPAITDPVIYRAYESTNPTVVVADSGNINPPHNAPRNITIPGVNPIPHLVRCYQLPTGSTTGILKKSFWIDPTFRSMTGEEVRFYVVDGGLGTDPTSGTRTVVDSYLDGKQYWVEIRDEGALIYEAAHTRDEYTQLTGGGFEISDPGFAWQPQQVICVHIQAQISTAVPIATTVSLFQEILTLNVSTDLSTIAWKKKLLNIESTSTQFVLTLDLASTVPNNTMIPITSQIGNQINVVLRCAGTDKIYWNRNVYSELYLGINDEIWLTVKDGFYYVVKGSSRMPLVGTRISSYSQNIPNTIFPTGQLIFRADYPALFKFLNDNPALLINEANWLDTQVVNGVTVFKNKGYFTLGTTSLNMRLPDWSNRFFRTIKTGGTDPNRLTQGSGGYQYSDNTPHQHFTIVDHSDTGGTPVSAINYVCEQGEQGGAGDFKYTLRGFTTAANKGLTSNNGGEGRPENLAEYSLLLI